MQGRVALRKLNLDGDRQADLNVHGGAYKAVYCYPLAYYDYWRKELPGRDLPMAMFGENFTIEIPDHRWHAGRLSPSGRPVLCRVGGSDRDPASASCYKLGVRFQADDMVSGSWPAGGLASTSPSPAREKSAPVMR